LVIFAIFNHSREEHLRQAEKDLLLEFVHPSVLANKLLSFVLTAQM